MTTETMINDQEADRFFKHDYYDRGLMKWKGYFLSDHTTKLHKKEVERDENEQRVLNDQMDHQDIDVILTDSYSNHKKIQVQYAHYEGDELQIEEIIGVMKGYYRNLVGVGDQILKADEIVSVKFEK